MEVFLIRPAEAVEAVEAVDAPPAPRDPARDLTPRGRAQAHALGDRLRWHDVHPTQVWASPAVRAVQTAALVVAPMACEAPVEVVPALAPDGAPRRVADALAALRARAPGGAVLIVGHEPGLSALVELLTGARPGAPLARAEAARIEDGRLRWRFAWDAEAPAIHRR